MNRTILVGRIGRNPDIKTISEGQNVANFSVATDEYYAGETHVEWHNCTSFGKTAEFIGAYISKGDLVEIDGKNQTREWTDKDGNKKKATAVIVHSIRSLMKAKPEPKPESKPGNDFEDDDIPF